MHRSIIAIGCGFILIFAAAGCSKKEATNAPAGASPAASTAPLPLRTAVTFNFDDVSVSTSGPPILRLGLTIHNISKDPVQCDPSEFTVQLPDGTVTEVDISAENKCTPDSLDPGVAGKAVVYFNLPTNSPGTVILSMTVNDAVVGRSTTTVK
ncbi:MAG TPA: DUF4352 domain-containing protein [Vicinamibacterales bacterium]